MTITRDFYYLAKGRHVVHFRTECPSYKRANIAGKYMAQPKGKTLCDHCQAIEKRLKRIAKAEARRAKNIKAVGAALINVIPKLIAKPKRLK